MKKILLNVSYEDESGKFWQDSYVKNKVIRMEDSETIHELVARVLKEVDGVVMSYAGKPQGNVFIDDKDGLPQAVGYIYRVRSEIYDDRNEPRKALFTAWVNVSEVIPCSEVVTL